MNKGNPKIFRSCVAVAAAMIAPAMVYEAGMAWQGLAPLAGICLLVSLAVQRYGNHDVGSWGYCLWQVVGILLILLSLWKRVGFMVGGESRVPVIVLILLAVAAGEGGTDATGKIAGILIWVMGGLLAMISISGLREIRWSRIPGEITALDMRVLPALLLPALYRKGTGKGWSIWPALGAVGICLLTRGLLGAAAAESEKLPFFEAAVQCSLSSSLSRLDGAVYFLGVLAGFSLFSCMFGLIFDYIESVFPGKGKPAVWISGGIMILGMACNLYVGAGLSAFLAITNWVILPLLM